MCSSKPFFYFFSSRPRKRKTILFYEFHEHQQRLVLSEFLGRHAWWKSGKDVSICCGDFPIPGWKHNGHWRRVQETKNAHNNQPSDSQLGYRRYPHHSGCHACHGISDLRTKPLAIRFGVVQASCFSPRHFRLVFSFYHGLYSCWSILRHCFPIQEVYQSKAQ